MFDVIYNLVLYLGFLCLAYLMGKKNSYDKGYDKGFESGFDSGYEDGQTDLLKQIYGLEKK